MGPDYPPTEMLTRLLALERMKVLSDAFLDAKAVGDGPTMRLIDDERKQLKQAYLRVIK